MVAASSVEKVRAGSFNFPTDSCVFASEKIWVSKISIVDPKFPKNWDFQP